MMSKTRLIPKKFKLILLAVWLLFSNVNPVLAVTEQVTTQQRYAEMSFIRGVDPELTVYIHKKSLNLDLLRTNNIRIRIKASNIYNAIEKISSFKISMYEIVNGERRFVSSQTLTIFKGTKKSRVVSIAAGYFAAPTKQVEFDVFDTEGNLINTYSTELSATHLDSQVTGGAGINLDSAECDYTNFDDCQLDYLFDRVTFEAKPQKQISTRIVKSEEGLYKVTIPVPRSQFKFLGRSIKRGKKDDSGQGHVAFGDTLSVSTIKIGPNAQDFGTFSYDPFDNQFTFGPTNSNTTVVVGLDGKVGIGVDPADGFLHVRGGDGTTPSVIIDPGTLAAPPPNGALEFDGSDLYFTIDGTREKVALGEGAIGPEGPRGLQGIPGPQGAQGPIGAGDNLGNHIATQNINVNGFSLTEATLESGFLNGMTLFRNNSTAKFNGNILIPANAGAGKFLTSDGAGNATWTALVGGGGGTVTQVNNGDVYLSISNKTTTPTITMNGALVSWAAKARPAGIVVGTTDTQTLTNKTLTSPWLQDPLLNGTALFRNNSTAKFNGSVLIPANAGANKVLTSDGAGAATWQTISGANVTGVLLAANNLNDVGNAATSRDNLGLEIGADVQAYDADLTTWAGKTAPAGTVVGTTDTQTLTNKTLTSPWLQDPLLNGTALFRNNSTAKFNGSILIPANAGANKVLTSDGAGAATWQTISGSNVTGVLLAANNLNDVGNAATSRDNLGLEIGADVQAYDADLTTWAGKTAPAGTVVGTTDTQTLTNKTLTSPTLNSAWLQDPTLNGTALFRNNSTAKFNGSILIPANAGANKVLTSDGSGAATWQTISGANVTGVLLAANNLSDVNSAATSRDNLGLEIGADVQAYDADLTTWAGKTAPAGTVVGTTDTQTLTNKTLTSPTLNSAWLQDPTLNGTALFRNNSTAKFNGSILIPANAGAGKFLTSDGAGNATWTALVGGGGGTVTEVNNGDVYLSIANKTTTPTITMNGALVSWAAKARPAGTVVGTTDTQTLTNKTLTSPTLNSAWLQDATLNGTALFRNNSTAKFNGSVLIPANAGANKVLTSDGSGNATWQALSALPAVDSTTLDGLDSTDFLRSNTTDNFSSGVLITDAGTRFDVNGELSIADTNIVLDGASTTFTGTGAMTLAPGAGTNLNVSLSTTGDLAVNTFQLYVDTSAARVGINKTNPAYTLDVNGTVFSKSQNFNGNTMSLTTLGQGSLLFSKVAGSLAALDNGAVSNHKVLKVNGNTLAWEAAGSGSPGGSDTDFQFNDAGSFGGNGALSFTKASKTLTVPADAPLDINSTSVSIADTNISFDGASTTFTGTGAMTVTPGAGTNLNVSLSTTGDFAVNTSQLYVDTSAARVAVNKTNPAYTLDVNGQIAAKGISLILGTDLSFIASSTDPGDIVFTESSGEEKARIYTDPTNNGLNISVNAATPVELVIDYTGKVGIGTASIDTQLEVNGATMSTTYVEKSLYSNTSGANVTVNWNNGNKQSITLEHNVTFTFTAPTVGIGSFTLILTQDGTGTRTVTWPASVKWPGGTAPTLSTAPGYIDVVTCVYTGSVYLCQIGLDFR